MRGSGCPLGGGNDRAEVEGGDGGGRYGCVFAATPDPVGAGFVESLARPGGNITGFTPYEYGIGAKWLEVLKEIAPSVARVAVVRDPTITACIGLWGAIQSVSPSFGVELRPVDVGDAGEIERALAAFAGSPNGGLILTGSALALAHRDLIIALAARYRLPAVYYERGHTILAATNKCLAKSSKTRTGGETTKKRNRPIEV